MINNKVIYIFTILHLVKLKIRFQYRLNVEEDNITVQDVENVSTAICYGKLHREVRESIY